MSDSSRRESELKTLRLTLFLYVIAFGVKLAGYFLTGIMVLLADALHSLSDLFIYGFLLVAMIWSRKEADEVHMFGYGRAQNVGALVAATLFIALIPGCIHTCRPRYAPAQGYLGQEQISSLHVGP